MFTTSVILDFFHFQIIVYIEMLKKAKYQKLNIKVAYLWTNIEFYHYHSYFIGTHFVRPCLANKDRFLISDESFTGDKPFLQEALIRTKTRILKYGLWGYRDL